MESPRKSRISKRKLLGKEEGMYPSGKLGHSTSVGFSVHLVYSVRTTVGTVSPSFVSAHLTSCLRADGG
jgi:hypothetical protein